MFDAFAALLAIATAAPVAVPTPQSLSTVAVRAPRAVLRLQIATTPAQRERGLMGVTKLKRHDGMLFVFEKETPVAFWMKDTLIPLDMVFVGVNGEVRKVFANVPVLPQQTPDADIPLEVGSAKYVIELASGEAKQDGLAAGVRLKRLPR